MLIFSLFQKENVDPKPARDVETSSEVEVIGEVMPDEEFLSLALQLESQIAEESVRPQPPKPNCFDINVPGVMNVPWPALNFNNCNVTINISK